MIYEGIIIWHHFDADGRIINSSTTIFHGSLDGLNEAAKENFEKNKGNSTDGKPIVVFHNFVLLSAQRSF